MVDYARIMLGGSENGTAGQLDQAAFDELIVALKAQEILAPNLALLWRIPGVDGFDGGVLPLRRYLDMLALFVPPDDLVPDGRLREQVKEVPDAKLLGLVNAQYVITDKVRDLWFEDVYYDRQIGARLGLNRTAEVAVQVPYPFEATHVDLIGYIHDAGVTAAPATNWTATTVTALAPNGEILDEWDLIAGPEPGAHFADSVLDSPMALQSGATVAYRDVENGMQEYRARLPLSTPVSPDRILIRHNDGPDVVVQAMTLLDDRTNMFLSLLPSDRGRFRRVHSGDVKVYENQDVLPRAYMVYEVIPVQNADEAFAHMLAEEFDPTRSAVVEAAPALDETGAGEANLVEYAGERVVVATSSDADGYLVLSDAIYPGWRATVDGDEASVYATNHMMRGVFVPAGDHEVVFSFEPDSWRRGLWLSLAGLLLAIGLLAWAARTRAGHEH
jgi:hypothetical protein